MLLKKEVARKGAKAQEIAREVVCLRIALNRAFAPLRA
jgi:hypothetical protein